MFLSFSNVLKSLFSTEVKLTFVLEVLETLKLKLSLSFAFKKPIFNESAFISFLSFSSETSLLAMFPIFSNVSNEFNSGLISVILLLSISFSSVDSESLS